MQIAAVAWQGETAAAERPKNRLGGSIAPRPRPGKKLSTIFVRRAHEDLLPQAVRLEAVRVDGLPAPEALLPAPRKPLRIVIGAGKRWLSISGVPPQSWFMICRAAAGAAIR